MPVMSIVAVTVLLVCVYVFFTTYGTPNEAGLATAKSLLACGQHISPQHHSLLLQALTTAEEGYKMVLEGDKPQGVARLQAASIRASAAAHELMFRAPSDTATQSQLQNGYDMMTAQLDALQDDVIGSHRDNSDVWNRYIAS